MLLAAALGTAVRYAAFLMATRGGDPAGYLTAFCVWDCGWYQSIAEGGYDLVPGVRLRPGAANWAFFPLSPLIAGAAAKLTSLPVVVCGFFLSNLYAILAGIAARPLFGENERAYWLYIVMLLAGPFSVLFSSLHTEALFVLLVTLAARALHERRLDVAGGFTALLSATRLTGILMILALGWAALERELRQRTPLRNLPAALLRDRQLVLGLAIAPLGLVAYMVFLRLHVGDGLAFLHIQRAWGRFISNPLDTIIFLGQLQFPLPTESIVVLTWIVAGIVGLALSVALALRRRIPEAIFCAACILVSFAGGATSMVRFVAGLAPLGMVLAELLSLSMVTYVAAFPLMVAAGFFITIGWINSSLFAM